MPTQTREAKTGPSPRRAPSGADSYADTQGRSPSAELPGGARSTADPSGTSPSAARNSGSTVPLLRPCPFLPGDTTSRCDVVTIL
jgi:hypothetical protein